MEYIRTERTTDVLAGGQPGVSDLPVERAWANIGTEEDPIFRPVVWSVWEPTAEERRAILEGNNIRLGIIGVSMPPVIVEMTDQERSAGGPDGGPRTIEAVLWRHPSGSELVTEPAPLEGIDDQERFYVYTPDNHYKGIYRASHLEQSGYERVSS